MPASGALPSDQQRDEAAVPAQPIQPQAQRLATAAQGVLRPTSRNVLKSMLLLAAFVAAAVFGIVKMVGYAR
jgi:hypothetical protein